MDRINVTKTFLPPKEEFDEYLDKMWQLGQITNQGPLLKKFEQKVREYLGVENFHFVSNGTIAIQVALRALDITDGEIITTPFSYVATTSSILWERCDPVFVDIKPDTFCIDVEKIEAAITDKTKAIMPVHVFGFPCDVEKISEIAQKHNIKVIYDAAHAFGVKYKGRSLLDYGDIATCSFHATKAFHTIEGGGIIVKDHGVSEKVELIKRFGHNGDDHMTLGINAKASEMQAAMGLCNFKYIEQNLAKRKALFGLYDSKLNINRADNPHIEPNYIYYPFVLKSEQSLEKVMNYLADNNIFPRRYFFPSLNELPYIKTPNHCPESESIARRILCLPLYTDLDRGSVERICALVNEAVESETV